MKTNWEEFNKYLTPRTMEYVEYIDYSKYYPVYSTRIRYWSEVSRKNLAIELWSK